MKKKSIRMRDWVFFLFSVFFSIALLEVSLSFWSPIGDFRLVLNSKYIYGLVPSSKRITKRAKEDGGDVIVDRVNSLGYRGPELRSRPTVRRVVVYGDSNIEAYYVEPNRSFTEQLELALQKVLGSDIEVVNAGVQGFGPDQVLVRIKDEILSLRPDYIVVGISLDNDFGDLLRNKLFRLGSNGELVRNQFRVSKELEYLLRPRTGLLHQSQSIRNLRNLCSFVKAKQTQINSLAPTAEGILRINETEFSDYVVHGDNTVSNIIQDTMDLDIVLTPKRPAALYKVQLMDRVIKRMVDEVGPKIPFTLLLLGLPRPISFTPSYFPDYRSDNADTAVMRSVRHYGIELSQREASTRT